VRYLARFLSRPWNSIAKVLLVLPVLPLYWLEKLAVRLESTFWWWVPAAFAGVWWGRRRRPRLIYSTGGAVSAHAAAAVAARLLRVPWIAEVQDPLPYQGLGRGSAAAWLVARLERLLHERATGVVYLTRAACQRARQRTGGKANCRAIYAGGEPCAAGAPKQGRRMLVTHAGTLSGSRQPDTLLQALAALAAQSGEVRGAMQVLLLGSLDSSAERAAREFPCPGMVEVLGKLPRREARQMIAEADVLLVIQNRDPVSGETIPSKTYEYLASGRPILGLVYRNPELAALLRQAGHSAVEVDDVSAIAQELGRLYERWRQGELKAEVEPRYTTAAAVAELVAWSRELRGAKGETTSERPARVH
jgi:hypothetical protein